MRLVILGAFVLAGAVPEYGIPLFAAVGCLYREEGLLTLGEAAARFIRSVPKVIECYREVWRVLLEFPSWLMVLYLVGCLVMLPFLLVVLVLFLVFVAPLVLVLSSASSVYHGRL